MSEQNKSLIRRLFNEVWNQGKVEVIPEIYSPDFVAHYQPPIDFGKGLGGVQALIQRTRAAFPDYHEEVHLMVAEAEYVVAWFTGTGVNLGDTGPTLPTGKRIEVEEIAIFRLQGGKVVEQRGIPDRLALLQQLGRLPALNPEKR